MSNSASFPYETTKNPAGIFRLFCYSLTTFFYATPIFLIAGDSNQCFYKPGTGSNNPFFRNIGLLNTGAKIVTGATLDGRAGEHY